MNRKTFDLQFVAGHVRKQQKHGQNLNFCITGTRWWQHDVAGRKTDGSQQQHLQL